MTVPSSVQAVTSSTSGTLSFAMTKLWYRAARKGFDNPCKRQDHQSKPAEFSALTAHLSTACKALLAECPNQAAVIATHSEHVWPETQLAQINLKPCRSQHMTYCNVQQPMLHALMHSESH